MLFKAISEIQTIIPVGNQTDFNRIRPHIQNAETSFLRPLLQEMFDELQEFYDEKPAKPEDPDQLVIWEDMTELLAKVQQSVIHLAYWVGFQVLNATISDGGFKRTESEKLKSLFKYQEDDLKAYFREAGFNAIDDILVFLETHITSFAEFAATTSYTELKQSFIPNTSTFNGIVDIRNSRLAFLRLRNHMNLVEDMEIFPILGADIYTEIKQEMAKAEPSAKVMKILPFIRKPIAYLSSALLMEESGADLTEKGLYFEATKAIDINPRESLPAKDSRIIALVTRNRAIGNAYLDQLKSYLAANKTDWPVYSGQTGSVLRRDNTNKKTFWA